MQKIKLDIPFLILWLSLITYGLLMVFSASSVMSLELTNNKSMFVMFRKQAIFVSLGIVVAIIIARTNYRNWRPYILWFNLITIFLLFLVGFTPLGVSVNGATRWLMIAGFQFQPSEMAKLVILVTVASMISESRRYKEFNTMKVLAKIMFYILFYGALIGIPQNHASVVMIIFLMIAVMLYFGGINKFIFFGSGVLAICGGLFVALSSEFRRGRIMTFLDPLQDKMGEGYQITQNWYALASGELLGVGLGYGRQKFGWLPEDHTDFILGIIGEELGFVGVTLLIVLFFLFIARGLYLAINTNDDFGTLIISGVIALISIQVMLNTAVISGLFPVTGVPLPFISYGGTYTIMTSAMIGMIFSVSKQNREEKNVKQEIQ